MVSSVMTPQIDMQRMIRALERWSNRCGKDFPRQLDQLSAMAYYGVRPHPDAWQPEKDKLMNMDQAITHGRFTGTLKSLQANGFLDDIQVAGLIQLTKNGVLPEGQEPAAVNTASSLLPTSGFKFGATSLKNQVGVHDVLVKVANRALQLTTQDFMFFDGLRTIQEQKQLVATGKSQTMQSKHLPQADGLGHAMDLVPTNPKGQPVWDWAMIYPVVQAVDSAATEYNVAEKIRWGGAWDRTLADFGGITPDAYKAAVQAYQTRHAGSDFIDGPHFELVS